MQQSDGRKTTQSHWDNAWKTPIRMALPSRLYVDILNFTRLLSRHVKPGNRYLEIGCAPGGLLAWVAAELEAEVSGLDYSEEGISRCKAIFKELNLPVKLYQEDMFNHKLTPESFNVVTSFGVIEHFDDPVPAIRVHTDLVAPGGIAIICIPNYSGIYLRLQKWADAESLKIHNLSIMNPSALETEARKACACNILSYPFGSLSPWMISWKKRISPKLAFCLCLIFNAVGLLQPFKLIPLAPIIVLEIHKN